MSTRNSNSNIDLEKIGLPKWPGLLVVGKSVSREQAKHIILRTEQTFHDFNHPAISAFLYRTLKAQGMQYHSLLPFSHGENHRPHFDAELNRDKGCVPLEYLGNDRIASSWVGGLHGWCNWDGAIRSANYNIGKWPSANEVMAEWLAIASAFPFLSLTCQLLSGEISEPNTHPLIEYLVDDGHVSARIPEEMLCNPEEPDVTDFLKAQEFDEEFLLDAIKSVFPLGGVEPRTCP